jgi:hypothetical protein
MSFSALTKAAIFGWLLATSGIMGCTGTIAETSEAEPDEAGRGAGAGGQAPSAPPADPPFAAECSARKGRPARVLGPHTAFQTRVIVEQLFGADGLADPQVQAALDSLPANSIPKGFDTETRLVSGQWVDGTVNLAGRLAALTAEQPALRETLARFLGLECTLPLDLDAPCGPEFARELVTTLARGPIDEGDLADLLTAHREHRRDHGERKAFAAFLASSLLSARSVLRFDSAEFDRRGTVDAQTLGARLAMTLTSGLPDATLRAHIRDESILDPDVQRTEAARLIRTDSGRATLRHFARQWLNMQGVRSPPAGPGFVATNAESAALEEAARDEVGHLFEEAMLAEGGTLADFFATEKVVPAHNWLARVYGTPTTPRAVATTLPDRRGLLTRVAFHLHGAHAPYLPLAHRGYGVQVTMLCGSIGALPDEIDTTLPASAPDVMSSRQYFEILTETGTCQGCHAAMNPFGYALTGYSVTGARLQRESVKHRTSDRIEDVDIDETISLRLDGGERAVSSASDLSVTLGQSAQVEACFVHRFAQFAEGAREDFLCAGRATPPREGEALTLADTILAYVTSSALSER